ncbi:MAG: helix-turn-helix domain-containing protein [Sedimentisphaerales bacterium]|nr:helix-turn-helix domain-containing protein [Sedimentisphaerales bacterium]
MKNCLYNFSIVKTLRNAKGMTLEVLAKETGLSIRTISDIELNKAVPSVSSLLALAKSFNVSATELFELSQKTVPQLLSTGPVEIPGVNGNAGNLIELKDLAVVHHQFKEETTVVLKRKDVLNNPYNEIIYIFTGQAVVTIEDKSYTINARESLCFAGNLPHTIKYSAGTEVVLFYTQRDNQIAKELADSHQYCSY